MKKSRTAEIPPRYVPSICWSGGNSAPNSVVTFAETGNVVGFYASVCSNLSTFSLTSNQLLNDGGNCGTMEPRSCWNGENVAKAVRRSCRLKMRGD